MSITSFQLKGFAMKAGAAVGAAAVLAVSAGPALADELPGPSDESPEQEFTDAAAVVNQYWRNHFTDYFTGSYAPPDLLPNTSVGIPGIYNSDVEQVPCGQELLDENNASYCGPGNFIAADDKFLHNQDKVGDSFTWFVVAHEWGHAIQAHLQSQYLPNVPQLYELQADCFGGAALAGATKDGTAQWEAGDNQELYDALVKLSDQLPWTDPRSHGDANQRVSSYNLGVENGTLGCLPPQ